MNQTKSVNILFFCLLIWMPVSNALLFRLLNDLDRALIINASYICGVFFPMALYVCLHKIHIREWIPFHNISITALFIGTLAGILLLYISIFINALFVQFISDAGTESYDLIMENPLWWDFFSMAVIPSIIEELMFRGLFYHAYKENGIVAAAIGSSIVFGFSHMNFMQLVSAIVTGTYFCLLVEVTGSIYTSMAAHAAFNGTIIALDHMGGSTSAAIQMLPGLGIRAFLCGIGLAVLLLWSVKHYKKEEYMRRRLKEGKKSIWRKKNFAFVTPVFVVTILLSGFYMILMKII